MRKSLQVAVSTGLLCAAAASLVWAVQPGEVSFVPRAYMTAHFGGTHKEARQNNFFYGMRLDRDATFDTRNLNLPPVVQLAFDRYGMQAASLYGMPFAQRKLALNQTEGEAAASETTYTAIDWTLLALGAIGIGYTISEVVNQKDTPDPASGGSAAGGGAAAGGGTTGGGGTATGGGGTATGGGGTATGGGGTATGGGGTATGGFTTQSRSTPLDHQHDSSSDAIEEYQNWLDGGTGQMGDLETR